jgi:hypothetical protein
LNEVVVTLRVRVLSGWQLALLFLAGIVVLVWALRSPSEIKLLTGKDCIEVLEQLIERRSLHMTPEEESDFKTCEETMTSQD